MKQQEKLLMRLREQAQLGQHSQPLDVTNQVLPPCEEPPRCNLTSTILGAMRARRAQDQEKQKNEASKDTARRKKEKKHSRRVSFEEQAGPTDEELMVLFLGGSKYQKELEKAMLNMFDIAVAAGLEERLLFETKTNRYAPFGLRIHHYRG
jgi:hypothetical protein